MTTTSQERTEYAAGESPQRRKFPWWLLLVGLALIALVLFLLNRSGDNAPAESGDATAEQGDSADGGGDQAADPDNPDVRPGKITAGGATVYPLQDDLTLADYDGQDVVGEGVRVESVVADEGFWVGVDEQDRVFVLLTGGAESAPQVAAGDTVSFDGVVVAHDDGFAEEIGVGADEGAARLKALAGHIEVAQYRVSE